jgi:hypothetical protein
LDAKNSEQEAKNSQKFKVNRMALHTNMFENKVNNTDNDDEDDEMNRQVNHFALECTVQYTLCTYTVFEYK